MATANQRQAIPLGDVKRSDTPIAKLYKLHAAAEAAKLFRKTLIDLLDHEGAESVQMKLDEIEKRIADHTAHMAKEKP